MTANRAGITARITARITERVGLGLAIALACGTLLLGGCSHESADWKQASLANSPEAYQQFLQQHPHSPEAAQAQTRIKELTAERDWQIAGAANTRESYQQFVTAHPDSKWVQEAKIRIENFAQAGASGGPAPGVGTAAAATGAATGATGAATAATGAAEAPPAQSPVPASPAPAARTVNASPAARTHTPAHARAHEHHAAAAGRVVQLGAFRSRARAQSEWKSLFTRFAALRSLTPHYVEGRSGGARIYRLQVHMSSPAAASGLCATLKRHARPCLRVNNA
jgi:hypothetical protein